MKDIVSRTSSWIFKQLPKGGDTKKAVEASSAYASEAAKELKRVFVVGESPGFMFVRLAGLSGAVAVAFGAYGAHGEWYRLCLRYGYPYPFFPSIPLPVPERAMRTSTAT